MKPCCCWQFAASLTDDSAGWLGRLVANHRSRCPACAAAWEACQRVERSLVAAAREDRTTAPARLAVRVAAAATLAAQRPTARPTGGRLGPALAAATLAAALLGGVFWWTHVPQSAGDSLTDTARSALEAAGVRIRLPDAARLMAANEDMEQPLRAEFEAMKADVRSVAGFLSRTLLPSELLAAREE